MLKPGAPSASGITRGAAVPAAPWIARQSASASAPGASASRPTRRPSAGSPPDPGAAAKARWCRRPRGRAAPPPSRRPRRGRARRRSPPSRRGAAARPGHASRRRRVPPEREGLRQQPAGEERLEAPHDQLVRRDVERPVGAGRGVAKDLVRADCGTSRDGLPPSGRISQPGAATSWSVKQINRRPAGMPSAGWSGGRWPAATV